MLRPGRSLSLPRALSSRERRYSSPTSLVTYTPALQQGSAARHWRRRVFAKCCYRANRGSGAMAAGQGRRDEQEHSHILAATAA